MSPVYDQDLLFSVFVQQTMLSILIPPTIVFKEFKNKKELGLAQEYNEEQAKKDHAGADQDAEGTNIGKAKVNIRDSQVSLR